MTYFKSWEEFEKAAERLYLQDPIKARYTIKYVHSKGVLSLKMTDDVVFSPAKVRDLCQKQGSRRTHRFPNIRVHCVQYTTEILQDLKKMDKFLNNLMRHMASKEH